MIQVIVFSKDRPLQLHGYLASLFKWWQGAFRVLVLVRANEPYASAYQEVCREFRQVWFIIETEFDRDLRGLLHIGREADLVCFGCDDAVYVAPVDVRTLEAAFQDPDLLGVSMRLGRTITRGMFGSEMPQPRFLPQVSVNPWDEQSDDGPSLLWDTLRCAPDTDWSYPWELVGTVYPGDYAREMVNTLSFTSPNTLEHAGSLTWSAQSDRRMMRAYPSPRLVLPAVNVVQSDFPNGIAGGAELTPEYLLELWQKGGRLDVDEFARQRTKWDTWRIGTLWLKRAEVIA